MCVCPKHQQSKQGDREEDKDTNVNRYDIISKPSCATTQPKTNDDRRRDDENDTNENEIYVTRHSDPRSGSYVLYVYEVKLPISSGKMCSKEESLVSDPIVMTESYQNASV